MTPDLEGQAARQSTTIAGLETSQLIDEKYQIVRILGEGGMGAVYEARHTGTGRRVAVKVIIGEHVENEAIVARFQREARAAGSIETQHIAHVLDTGTDKATGHPYMVMEYLHGEDVQQCVRRVGPLDPDVALRVLSQACVGLQKAHDAGVIHRDIKPANLYLASQDDGAVLVKLLDFGIAKVKADQSYSTESASLTRTGSLLGSPLYMSPEQAMSSKSIDARTDVWSLGIVLYEILCGQTPFAHCDSFGALIMALCSSPAKPVQELAPWVPPDIARIVQRALEIDVNRRYGSVVAMHADVRALLPQGHALTQGLIAAVSPERRGFVAPKLGLATLNPSSTSPSAQAFQASERSGLSTSSAARTIADASGVGASSVPGTTGPGTNGTSAGVEMSQTGEQKRSRTVLIAGASAFVVLASAAGGIYQLKLRPQTVTATALVEPAASLSPSAPSSALAPASGLTSAPTPSASAAPVSRTVQIAILPKNASAEVDGAPVTVVSGAVAMSGLLGSVHKVRIFVGKKESTTDVVISETGPVPQKIELDSRATPATQVVAGQGTRPASSQGATPVISAPKTATPQAVPTPPKPDNAGVDRKFE